MCYPSLSVLYSHFHFLPLYVSLLFSLSLCVYHIPSLRLSLFSRFLSICPLMQQTSQLDEVVREQPVICVSLGIAPNSQNVLFKAAENIRSECATEVDHYLILQSITLPICSFIQLKVTALISGALYLKLS